MSACILAVDSSTECLALALAFDGRAWTVEENGGPQASARVLPSMMALLAEAGAPLQQLQAIAFGRGPGAFTGLRTACSVAQGLAFGSGKPVLALDSLMLVAEDARGAAEVFDVWVAMDARMGEIYAGRYVHQDGEWTVRDAPALYELDALHARWSAEPPAAVAGSALAAFGDRLPTGGAQCFPAEKSRAAALLRVAQWAWRRGDTLDAAEALPLYLRDKVALTTAERQAQRPAKAAT